MAKPLDKRVKDLLTKHEINPREACWDCHGTWVIYHRYCEIIAIKEGITFDQPNIVEADAAKQIVVLCVTGRIGDFSAWSFGEAAPYNLKGAKGFPYAMAEKRAKDRVILKLAGIHGLVYSEEEADAFKPGAPQKNGLREKVKQITKSNSVDILPTWNKLKSIGLNPDETKKLWAEALAAAGAKTKDEITEENFTKVKEFVSQAVKERSV